MKRIGLQCRQASRLGLDDVIPVGDGVTIGRGANMGIRLPVREVSGAHAKIEQREGVWMYIDSLSTNGALINGKQVGGTDKAKQKLGGEIEIKPGDSILIFRIEFIVVDLDEAGFIPERPTAAGLASEATQFISFPADSMDQSFVGRPLDEDEPVDEDEKDAAKDAE